MDYDIQLREYLINDPEILKHEFKLLYEYFQCKVENCNDESKYNNKNIISNENKNSNYITDEDYMECWKQCSNQYSSFLKIKQIVYRNAIDIFYKESITNGNKNASELFIKDFDKFKKLFKNTYMT